MDTTRVDICYRPLRIGWAIRAGDTEAFRQAVRLTHALWGGRFNPIVVVDREDEADRLVDLFRVDVILPVGDSDVVKAFPKRYPHLITPFMIEPVIVDDKKDRAFASVLDVHNALIHLRDNPEWKAIKDKGFRTYNWQAVDPLADTFLIQFGAYPRPDEIGIDYRDMLVQATEATEYSIDPAQPLPVDTLDHPSIAFLSRWSLERHYGVQAGSSSPGYFVGDATNLDDMICHWNLRASDISLMFIDPNHLPRYADIIPAWGKLAREMVSDRRHEWDRKVGVWSRNENMDEVRKPFGDLPLLGHTVTEHSWNGHNVRPPMMYFDQVSTLGVIGREFGNIKVSFPLSDKPFCGDTWFHTQHLVASVSFIGGLYNDDQHTLAPPYLPELNEFYARTMYIQYDTLRIEPGRVGLVIDAADTDSFLYALPVTELMEHVFEMAGFKTEPSPAGLITRQLIARLGGLQGGRVFKIPGVRRLLKTHGPGASFTKNSALQLIASKDPDNPDAKFADHDDLYIESRPLGTKLEPSAVFSHLVENGLFRIGVDLTCASCRMASWTALDALKQQVLCELCGDEYDATRQLVNSKWYFRRSGVLGREKNAEGAVPVALTLQQLETNLGRILHDSMYSPSLNLLPMEGCDAPKCEVDFVWIIARDYPRKTAVILGECKDQGSIKLDEFEKDVENLRRVADALPKKRFKTFILLTKLAPFTPEEIEVAKTLNDNHQYRAILLTARELEPTHIYERTKLEFDIKGHASSPEDLVQTTAMIYFKKQPGGSENGE